MGVGRRGQPREGVGVGIGRPDRGCAGVGVGIGWLDRPCAGVGLSVLVVQVGKDFAAKWFLTGWQCSVPGGVAPGATSLRVKPERFTVWAVRGAARFEESDLLSSLSVPYAR